MAEYGLIKDTTLQDMGEALRNKGFVSETRVGYVDYVEYKSSNATSFTDPAPLNGDADSQLISVPGATSLEIELNIGLYREPGAPVGYVGSIYLFKEDGRTQYWNSSYNASSYGSVDYVTHTQVVAGNKVIIEVSSFNSSIDRRLAAVAKIYALDADGNRIKADVTVQNTLTPSAMVAAINDYEFPPSLPDSAMHLTGDFSHRFRYGSWDWFVESGGDNITTADIINMNNAFYSSKLEEIPFVLNINDSCYNLAEAFQYMYDLKECPKIRGNLNTADKYSSGMIDLSNMLTSCYNIRDWEDLFEPGVLKAFSTFKVTRASSCPKVTRFHNNYSLRRVPSWYRDLKLNEESTVYPSSSYSFYYYTFTQCFALDEALNIPVWKCAGAQTSSMFNSTFESNYRLKDFTFETNDGQPITTEWKNQTINLIGYLGYTSTSSISGLLSYNSGITEATRVTDDASYQTLKNDPDWWTTDIAYSRYNHDSAVNTINSLPDTSAYLASAGGTNTIKFNSASGSKTDGGAINTLTEAEIAVATAKGWTVTFV